MGLNYSHGSVHDDDWILDSNTVQHLSRESKLPYVERVQLAGSARRRKETIGDLDIVVGVKPENHEKVANAILALQGIADVKGAGDSNQSHS